LRKSGITLVKSEGLDKGEVMDLVARIVREETRSAELRILERVAEELRLDQIVKGFLRWDVPRRS